MSGNPLNVRLGVCNANFGGVDLGLTKGGVEVSITTQTHQVVTDQYGESVVNEYITKREVSVTIPLAETTLANFGMIMPGSSIVSSIDGAKKRVDVTNGTSGASANLLNSANPLILHPSNNDALDLSEDVYVYKAATSGSVKFAYRYNEERIFNVVFSGYPDKNNGNKLLTLGDYTLSALDPNQLYDSLGVALRDSLGVNLVSL